MYDITVQLPFVEADVDVGAGPVPPDPPEEPPDPPEDPDEVDVPDEPDEPEVPDDPLVPLLLLVPELVPPPSSPPPLLVPLPLDEPVPSRGPLEVPPELAPPEPPPFEPPFDEPPPNCETGVELLLHATAPTVRPSKLGTRTSKPLGSLDPRDESFDMTFPLSMAASAALMHQVSRERPPGNAAAVSCWLKVIIPWHDMVTGRP